MQNHLHHWCSPTWGSRKEVIDALGYRFAALCREKLLLFGHKHHHPGHLIKGCLCVWKSPGQESVLRAELHVVVLQGQEWHEEINEVLFEEVAVGITILCGKTRQTNFRSFTWELSSHCNRLVSWQGPVLAHPHVLGEGHPLVKSCSALSLNRERHYSFPISGQKKPESLEKP